MKYKKIDKENWPRSHYYDYFMNTARCQVGMAANVDITSFLKSVKGNHLRFYPTITYAVARVINSFDEFKIGYNKIGRGEVGELVLWNVMHIKYPMFNTEDKTITAIWLEYCETFKEFYEKALRDIEKYSGVKSMSAKPNEPINFFDMTSIPWVSFTNLQCDVYNTDGTWLLPFVAVGKFFEQDGKVLLPVHFKVHHALCDGYHVGVFFNELQNVVNSTDQWLKI